MRNSRLILGVVIVSVLVVVGIVVIRGQREETVTEPVAVVEEPTVIATEVLQQESTEQEVEPAEEKEADPEQESAKPTPKAGLVATNPSDVNLTTGQLQFVEAFAFW